MIGLMQSQSCCSRWVIFLVILFICAGATWFPVPVKAESGADSSLSRQTRHLADSLRFPQRLPWRHVPAHSILLKELKTGETLYQFESERRLSPASLTKIMSALVILEHGHLDDEVTVSPRAAHAHKTRLRLRTGQIFRLEDLLKAMLIVSANDACLAAIEHVGGDEDRFVDVMNAKAAGLGLTDTHFSNACGFDSANHYSTAEDLAKLSEIALRDQVFKSLAVCSSRWRT